MSAAVARGWVMMAMSCPDKAAMMPASMKSATNGAYTIAVRLRKSGSSEPRMDRLRVMTEPGLKKTTSSNSFIGR